MWIGLLGGFLFILIQLILIVDFAHGLAESWVSSYEENESRSCFYGLLTFTFFCYGLSLAVIIFMYLFYTQVKIFFKLYRKNLVIFDFALLLN